jgi:tetratricopeptide (TPR) repeat protein
VVAVGAAAVLNVALLATFVWTELLAPGVRILYWILLLAAWGFSAGLSGWLNRREQSRLRAEANKDIFSEALDHYLRGNWVEAERALSRLLRRNRRDAEARLMLATLLRHTRRWEEAARQLDLLVRLEEARNWELEIGREAELLAAARGGNSAGTEDDQDQGHEGVSGGGGGGAQQQTELPPQRMHAA